MTGLFSLRFTRHSVEIGFVWRLFATCIILLTTAMLLRDRTVVLRLSREKSLQGFSVNKTHITPHPYDGTPVKPEVGTTTQLNVIADKVNTSKSDSRVGHVTEAIGIVKPTNPGRVNLKEKYKDKGKKNYTMFKWRPTPRVWTNTNSLQLFNISITLEEKFVFKELFKEFTKIAKENKLEYFLCSGSLLGSYRHHGMIPWDDDADVMMNSSHKEAIKSAFQFSRVLTLHQSKTVLWKVYFKSSNRIKDYPWKWPFLDLIFFKENITHIWDMNHNFPKACFLKSWIFPTVSRPFWDLWLPAPRDTERVLKKEFNVDECASPAWNHKLEKNRLVARRLPCRSLYGRVPFVHRQTLNDSNIIETLYLDNKPLSAVLTRKP